MEEQFGELFARYGREVMQSAALVITVRSVLRQLADKHAIDYGPILDTLDKCVESHLIQHDVHPELMEHVIADLLPRAARDPRVAH